MEKEAAHTKSDIQKMYTAVEKELGVKIDRKLTSPEDIKRLFKKFYSGRTTVGSRNPYAAVEHELGIKINWKKSDPKSVEKLLTKKSREPSNSVIRNKNSRVKRS